MLTNVAELIRQFCDPDIHFAWHDVLQVIVPTSSGLPTTATAEAPNNVDAVECPICLSPPSAARMSRCGHIACFAVRQTVLVPP